jgi:DNA-directed RNA polymerase II subunit RPB1
VERIRYVKDPKKRMVIVWNHCKTKMVCEPDEPKEEDDDEVRDSSILFAVTWSFVSA